MMVHVVTKALVSRLVIGGPDGRKENGFGNKLDFNDIYQGR